MGKNKGENKHQQQGQSRASKKRKKNKQKKGHHGQQSSSASLLKDPPMKKSINEKDDIINDSERLTTTTTTEGSGVKRQKVDNNNSAEKPAHSKNSTSQPNGEEATTTTTTASTATKKEKKTKKKKLSRTNHEPINDDDENNNTILPETYPTIYEIINPPSSSSSPPSTSPTINITNATPKERSHLLLQSLLHPSKITTSQFYRHYFEKKPLLVKSTPPTNNRDFSHLLSLSSITTLLQTHPFTYGRDLNVTNYKLSPLSGRKTRVTLDPAPDTLADPSTILKNFAEGCSLRFLRPQKHVEAIHTLISTLELEFGCTVGANAYLTPGGGKKSQGFAPHYDDVEVFVMQLEGRKRWRVYEPPAGEVLPRESSRDLEEGELGDVALDVVLEEGDVLYMPRGWIHQAETIESKEREHSLHLTVSVYQNWSWCDLLEVVMPEALEDCIQESVGMREGLPKGFLEYMGVAYEEEEEGGGVDDKGDAVDSGKDDGTANGDNDEKGDDEKEEDDDDDDDDDGEYERRLMIKKQQYFQDEAKKRIMRVCHKAMTMINPACDQLAKRFLSERSPPSLPPTSHSPLPLLPKTHPILPSTMVRLLHPTTARLAIENSKAVFYHCCDNVFNDENVANELSPLEFELDDAPVLEILVRTVEPMWVRVGDLGHEGGLEESVAVVESLRGEGVLALWEPGG